MSSILEERLRRGIDLIRNKVSEMAIQAERATEASLKSLTENNRKLAYAVILRDQRIDQLEKELDRLCLEFLVRQQPVAGHLRFVYATIKINTDLERIGDYAESIARQVLFISSIDRKISMNRFIEIGELAIKMLHDATRSFIDQNADLARKTIELERQVDWLRTQIRVELLQLHRDGKITLEEIIPMLVIAARFERVADQSVNICEEVLYICTGEVLKHSGLETFRVLFLSKGNSMRSQMAEGIANSLGMEQFVFTSAGLTPRLVDPRVVSYMKKKGIDISMQNSKSIQQVPNLEHYQVIILLSKEVEESAPILPAKSIMLQWLTPDPSYAEGSVDEIDKTFDKTFEYLNTHIRDFVQAVLSDEMYP
ncbi:MAG: phosphate signaling complex protein PhoU [Candidatus Zhuqueibacterota bacterium]